MKGRPANIVINMLVASIKDDEEELLRGRSGRGVGLYDSLLWSVAACVRACERSLLYWLIKVNAIDDYSSCG